MAGIYHSTVPATRLVRTWLPAVAWAALIFALSSVPHLGTQTGGWDVFLRKLAHMAEYGILGVLLYRAIGRELPAFTVGILYAESDEIHQFFVRGRHAAPLDVGFDALGLALAIVLLLRARR